MVDFCLNEELKIFLEIPLPDNLSLELVSDYVVNELYSKKSGLYSKAVVISAWPHVIFAIRQKDPRIVCGLIWSPKLLQSTFPRYRCYSSVPNSSTGFLFLFQKIFLPTYIQISPK